MPKPKATIERVDGMCTNSGIAYEVIAPNGYCVIDEGEHVVAFDTRKEAQKAAKAIRPCPCNECTLPMRPR
jgi:hypothetical protein